MGDHENMTMPYKAALFGLAWSMILTAVGFGALHLNRKSAALAWLNRKIFPRYIVHQTIIVAALFYILPLEAGVAAKISLVLLATIGGIAPPLHPLRAPALALPRPCRTARAARRCNRFDQDPDATGSVLT
jgi:hypothetical protein